jgi:cell division septation protein DedD
MPRRALQCSLILAVVAAPASRAQAPAQARPATAADSVFARAQSLVTGGNGAAGRVLVDSMLTVAAPGTPAYAEALFWRASLAASSADAETDFRRIISEYPLSPRSGEALLKLAQLETDRGDRAAAITHLQRFLLENPASQDRPRIALQLVRLSFDQNEPEVGCVFLSRVLTEIPDADVELKNQLAYYSPRCASVDTTHVAGAPPAPAPDSTKRETKRDTKHEAKNNTKRDTTTAAPTGKYTLQVAAYTTRTEADRLVGRLKGRGIEARVVGTAKLFRVRIGRYETRAAAEAVQRDLKAKKIDAFVTDVGTEEK